MTQKGTSPIGVGALTVITVLLVLTLAVFSVLTFSSARADRALSETNAETVTAYYEADSQATYLFAEFQSSTADELEEIIPMTELQSLYVHFVRQEDGSAEILAWKTISTLEEDEFDFGGIDLPVFGAPAP